MTSTASQRDSRNSLLAEITGYLGGAFVLISLAIFVGERFDTLDKVLRSGLFALLSGILASLTLWLGNYSSLRSRMSSVLGLGSSVSMTISLSTYFEIDRAPLVAFAVGTAITAAFFFKNRTELLHLGTAVFLFITSIMVAATIVDRDTDSLTMPAAASF
jgi:uncharacterized membrane protein YdcZ (DUF606 family)